MFNAFICGIDLLYTTYYFTSDSFLLSNDVTTHTPNFVVAGAISIILKFTNFCPSPWGVQLPNSSRLSRISPFSPAIFSTKVVDTFYTMVESGPRLVGVYARIFYLA